MLLFYERRSLWNPSLEWQLTKRVEVFKILLLRVGKENMEDSFSMAYYKKVDERAKVSLFYTVRLSLQSSLITTKNFLLQERQWGKGCGHTQRNQKTSFRKLGELEAKALSITILITQSDHLSAFINSSSDEVLMFWCYEKTKQCFKDVLLSMQHVLCIESPRWEAPSELWVTTSRISLF